MPEIFKGKIKYNPLYVIAADERKWLIITAAMCALAFFPVLYFEENADRSIILCLVIGVMIFSFLYGRWYANRMRLWDKPGFDELAVFAKEKYLKLDKYRMIAFNDIDYLSFSECCDSIPYLPKSYDLINAELQIHLKNGEVINFYVQQVSKIFKMNKYFNSLGLHSDMGKIGHSPLRIFQAHYAVIWIITLIFIILTIFIIAALNQGLVMP